MFKGSELYDQVKERFGESIPEKVLEHSGWHPALQLLKDLLDDDVNELIGDVVCMDENHILVTEYGFSEMEYGGDVHINYIMHIYKNCVDTAYTPKMNTNLRL